MRQKSLKSACLGALGAVLMACPAAAQSSGGAINALSGDEIEQVLLAAGMAPTMLEDVNTGAPVASASSGDVSFAVRALDCAGEKCSTLVFFANFELGRPMTESDYKIVNRFNDGQVFGRAYVLDEAAAVGVDYVIELDGGVSKDHISNNISKWADVVSAFIEHFRAGSADS